jgi:hypothetical protein
MEWLDSALTPVLEFIRREPLFALAGALGALLLLLLLNLALFVRQIVIGRRQRRLLRGADGKSLEGMLLESTNEMAALRARVERASHAGESNAQGLKECLQKVSVVRYDAVVGTGGRQSFSMAVLDGEGSGIVFSALHTRTDMRVYAKPITRGVSPLPLTAEETRAIAEAKAGGSPLVEQDEMPGARQ